MKQKSCNTCGVSKLLKEFEKEIKCFDGHLHKCKKCQGLARQEKMRTDKDYLDRRRTKNRRDAKRFRMLNPEKMRVKDKQRYLKLKAEKDIKLISRDLLHRAVRSGKIIKPEECSECGFVGRINSHHEDYSKPLDVVWLCTECHGKTYRIYT